jgi:light-regulated signal transduction histidine kinase (bacteriophytochrome)
LRMMTSFLQLIERRYSALLDDDGRDFIRFAVDGATRMRALINGLLDLSRAGSGAGNLFAVSADSLLQNALDNLKTAIDESAARVTAGPLPTIVADPILLTQVFQNLIGNAIKFHKQGAPCVHISALRQAGDWIFSVHDNGIGIDARHFDQVFKIFERLHSSEEFSGSGIGLAVTRKIVERHGGKIWVESQPGTGSTFYFSIAAETALASAANSGLRS